MNQSCVWALAALIFQPLCAEVRLLTGDANDAIHDSSSELVDVSADGDLVVFVTGPPVTGSTPGIPQGGAYLRTISSGALDYLAGDSGAYVGVSEAVISDDGRYVAWESTTHAVSGTSGNARHIYWRDRQEDITRLLTAAATDSGSLCIEPKISGDGRYVTFVSASRSLPVAASKLPTVEGRAAIYRYDSVSDTLDIVSLAPDGSALTGIGSGVAAPLGTYDFSSDGNYVVYTTDAPNAHPDRAANMTPGFLAVCRRNLATGSVDLVNRNAAGNVVDGNFASPAISGDGNRVGFVGSFVAVFRPANLMVPGLTVVFDNNAFVKDLGSGEVWWVSRETDDSSHGGSFGPRLALDGDGDVLSFASSSNMLVAQDSDPGQTQKASFDIFRVDLGAAGAATHTLITESSVSSDNVDYTSGPFLPGTGQYVAFTTQQVEEMLGEPSTFRQGLGVGTFPGGGSGGLSYSDWAEVLPEGDRDFTDNPAMDGVDNLTKFFLGMDPTTIDRSQLPTLANQPGTALGLPGDTEVYLTLAFRIRRDLPPGFSWTVRTSDSLSGLVSTPGSAIQVGTPIPNGDFDLYLFRYPSPQATTPGRGFMDVLMTGSP